ncbi:glycosyltransferase [Chryseobacterium sp. PBS4-4]|uniref:Glycosyltransferase n=1 Tax=Chryseobacterium edaphi TaxID=2976532 RepID=A0ABT2W775_9FLAO|nr:glycosyltransferase [Chryseobacterium edaphi]MCU7617835.1 glycosyltransferase [Chryseobacterium edaphi]
MTDNPLVSILCLCYNQGKFIKESLESIKAQTYKNFEIIICDDFSHDESVEIIKSWISENKDLKIEFIEHHQNLGITKTLNELLKISQGKYIQILALDDILIEEKLDRHVAMLENSSDEYALVFSDAHLINHESKLYQNKFIARHFSYLSLESQNFYEMLLTKNFIPAMSVLMKKKHIMAENGWDESLPFEDYDMWLRLSKNHSFLFDDVITCSYRLHDNNSHRKKNVINYNAFFNIFIKHTQNIRVRNILFSYLEDIYREKLLTNEHKIFYSHYPMKSFSERFIKNNYNPKIYRVVLEIQRFTKYFRILINSIFSK